MSTPLSVPLNPFYVALLKLRRRKYDECIDLCGELLRENPRDTAAWWLKVRAMTQKEYIDDIEMDEGEGLGDLIFDENSLATAPRPGTVVFKISWGKKS